MRYPSLPHSIHLRATLLGTAALIGLSVSPAMAACVGSSAWSAGISSWFTSTNWTPNGVPNCLTTVGNGGTAQIGSAANVSTLTVNGGSILELDSGGSLAVGSGVTSLNIGGPGGDGTLRLNGSGAITVGGSSTAGFTLGGFLIDMGSDTLTNAIALNGTTVIETAGTLTLSGVLSGSGSTLFMNGSGDLTLSGANTYNGGTLIAGGRIVVGNDSALGGGLVEMAGGTTLKASGTRTLANDILLDAGGATVDNNSQTFTLSGTISGASLIIQGGGTVILSGNNTYSGGTTVKGNSTLVISNDNNLGNAAGGLILGDATTSGTLRAATFSAGLFINATRAVILNAGGGILDNTNITAAVLHTISGVGSLTVTNSAGSTDGVFLQAVNTYTGTTTITSSGVIFLAGNGDISSSSGVIDNGILSLPLINSTGTSLTSLSGSGTVSLGAKNLTLTGNASTTFSGVIGLGSGALIKQGTGALTLSGANTYSGGTTISGNGAIVISADNNLGAAGSALILGDASTSGTLQTTADVTTARAITVNAGGGTLDYNSHTLTISNAIGGTGPLTIKSTVANGSVTLTLPSTYTGATTIKGGSTLILTGTGDIASSSGLTTFGTFNIASITGTGTSIASLAGGSGNVQLGAKTLTLTGNASTTFSGIVIGAGSSFLIKQGGGTLTVGNGGLLAAGAISVESGAIQFNQGSSHVTPGGITTSSGASIIYNQTSAAAVSAISGAGNFISNNTATVTVVGAMTNAGTTTINSGTFLADAANRFAPSSATTVASGATLDLGSQNQTIGSLAGAGIVTSTGGLTPATLTTNGDNSSTTFSGVIKNGPTSIVSLTKTGTGNLILTGANTYTGATIVSGGTLSVNGSLSASSAVTVQSGGTLGGTGTVGATVIAAGGALAPGNSIGTLHVSGNLSFASGASYGVELSPTAADDTIVSGTATIASGASLFANFALGGGYSNKTYTLLTSTGVLTGTFSTFNTLGLPSGDTATLSYDAHDVFLVLSTPPSFIWGSAPGSGDWNTAANWQSGTVPTAANPAIFDTTSQSAITISAAAAAFSLQFNAAAPAYGFAISGSSSGPASLTLAGGITDNSRNTPSLAAGGVSGTNSGTLAFTGAGTAADAALIANNFGTISFAGAADAGAAASLTANGGGTVDFSATSGTAGNQQVNAGSIAGAGSFVLGANTLTAGANNASTEVSGVISGSGGLTKVGSGTLTLSGAETYTGPTTVNAGTLLISGSVASTGLTLNNGILDVNGALPAAAIVTVNGGALKGSGTLGAVTISGGGTAAPGNSIGTMNVASVTFANSFSVYQAEVDNAGHSDLINASGKATINGGTVQAIEAAGVYQPVSTYVIINAAGGVSGTFNAVTSSLSNLNPSLVYTADTVSLRLLRNDLQFATYGNTPNQVAVGGGVTASGASSGLYSALANVANSPGAVPAGLDSLSGEIYESQRSALIDDDRLIRNSVLDHLASGSGDGVVAWGTGFASAGDIQGDGNAATLNHTDAGIIFGADMPLIDGLRAGMAVAITDQALSVPARLSHAGGSTNHVVAYGRWSEDNWRIDVGEDYGWGDSDFTRVVGPETNKTNDGHHTSQAFAEASYDLREDTITLEPHAGMAWMEAHTAPFAETGGPLSTLSGGGRTSATSFSNIGLRLFADPISFWNGQLMPRFDLGWAHDFSALPPNQSLAFTGASFTVMGVPLATDAGTAAIGLDFKLASGATISLGYDGLLSSRATDNAVTASFGWKF